MSTVAQAQFYFDSLDPSLPHTLQLDYAPTVARFEWPPWALLTGLHCIMAVHRNIRARITVCTRHSTAHNTAPQRHIGSCSTALITAKHHMRAMMLKASVGAADRLGQLVDEGSRRRRTRVDCTVYRATPAPVVPV